MSKPIEIPIDGKNYFAWPYEDQTKIKHKVLCAYVKIWVSKLGSKSNTFFFDCHGGCGAYIDDGGIITFGSAIQVRQIANEVNKNRNSKTGIFCCEIDNHNYENYKVVLLDAGNPVMVIKNTSFEEMLKDPNVKKYYSHFPTLFFVDPFGYSFDINCLAPMMRGFGNEIIINFMFDFINRFISIPSVETTLNQFFGSEDWKKARSMSGKERELFLVNTFKERLRKITGAKFVFAYRLCHPNRNQTYYYLIHATNHIDGITLMKESFSAINYGNVQYLGKNNSVITLFDMIEYKADEMYDKHFKQFSGQTLTFERLWELIVEDTAYTRKDLNEAIKELERKQQVTVKRVSSKRQSYKEKDEITLL